MISSAISSNRVHQTLLNKQSTQAVGPLRHSDSANAILLQNIAKASIADSSVLSKIRFTTGIGLGQTDAMPVRLPALLVPVLQVMRNIAALNLPVPRYTVYQATDFIAQTNGIDDDRAHALSSRMKQYLLRYIQTLHPTLVDSVDLHFNCECTPHIRASIGVIADDVRSDAATVMSALESSEVRYSRNSGQALLYAAANALYSGAYADLYPFKGDLTEGTSVIVPVGGKSEQSFFQITSAAARRSNQYSIMPLLTQLGSRPTYYPDRAKGDPCTASEYASAIEDITLSGPIRADLSALLADGATPAVIADIFPHIS